MNKKISLGAAIALMFVVASITVSITMVFSMQVFNGLMADLQARDNLMEKVEEIDTLVRDRFNGTIEEEKLLDSLSEGYLSGIGDKYARYYTAEEYADMLNEYNGKITGIGVAASKDESGYIRVDEIYDGSPAAAEGLVVGDLIVKVEGEDVVTLGYEKAISRITGEAGTSAKLTVRREGVETDYTITRRVVEVPTVKYRMNGTNGIIQITEFNTNTPTQFRAAVSDCINQGATGLVFDVRNNPGGVLDAVTEMLDYLCPEGTVVTLRYKDGTTKTIRSDADSVKLPMTVLINGSSASGAELFAQALKDIRKSQAVLIGTTTYGKGVMQETFKLTDGSAVSLTVAYYDPPTSPNYDGVGVKPDYEVVLSAEEQNNADSLTDDTDPQIKKALEIIEALKR
ncbi:MAG: S41 family peptidase [Oscillospiraceae bacterium]|nr:S41 family peptidase [Oscillospiraceae bacterium]